MARSIFKGAIVMIGAIGILTGCSTAGVQDYKNEKPKLVLEEYLKGNLVAHGFFQDRSGLIVKRFKVLMKGTWNGTSGTLDEDFEYSDGSVSKRIWSLKKESEGIYTGTASDVIGEAKGESAGNAFRWKYTLDLPVGDKKYHVQFDDWMYLMDDEIMINKSKMYKFGIYLGEVTLVFLRKK